MTDRAVFLDRDGVINEAVVVNSVPFPPTSLKELRLIPGAQKALESITKIGYKAIIVTNQPDVARGKTSKETVDEIHSFLMNKLPISMIKCCFHDDADFCGCRKPLPGGILEAAKLLSIDVKKSFMIGDRWKDIEAGRRAHCKTMFIDYGYAEQKPNRFDYLIKDLPEAAKIIEGFK